MKLRVLTATNKGKLLEIADILCKKGESTYAVDVIPPAYSCEKERLVILVISAASKMPNSFEIFCKDLSRARTQHVALLVDKKKKKTAPIVEWIRGAGANVLDEILYMKGGLPFKFARSVSDEEKNTALAWFDRVLAEISKV